MKTFVMGMFMAVAASALLSTSAHAQTARYWGGTLPVGAADNNRDHSLTARGLQWALSQRGKVVGDGQCGALAEMHLAVAEAIPGDYSDPKNYIWGAKPSDGFRSGDVIQFEGCYFYVKNSSGWRDFTMEHHTAIIVGAKGSVLTILDQNGGEGGGGPVVMYDLDLKWKQRGTFTVWRPVR